MSAPLQTNEPNGILELHLHRLLVAVDSSQTADLALSAAVAAARRDHAAITLLAVVPNLLADAGRWITAAGTPDPATLQDEADAEARRRLHETVARIPDDIPVTTIIRYGKPGPEIVAEAADHDYDAILVGARGVGRIGALLGSVSAYVVGHAGTAVFVAHAPAAEG